MTCLAVQATVTYWKGQKWEEEWKLLQSQVKTFDVAVSSYNSKYTLDIKMLNIQDLNSPCGEFWSSLYTVSVPCLRKTANNNKKQNKTAH